MTAHPLDPLGEDEFRQVSGILGRERGVARPEWRIASIELAEPAKELVREFRPGDPIIRRARAVLWHTGTGIAYVALVSLTLSGVLGGIVGFTKNGAGTLVFSGPASNTYLGTTTVNAGLLQLMKDGIIFSATAIPGNLVIGNGVSSATVQNIYGIEIADTATLVINNNGTYDLNGQIETVGTSLMFNGNSATVSLGTGVLTLSSPSAISVNGNNCAINGTGSFQLGAGPCGVNVIGTLKVFPSVQGAADITKTGPGNLFLYGANTYAGLTTVSQGWLWAENSLALGGTTSGTVSPKRSDNRPPHAPAVTSTAGALKMRPSALAT